MSSRLLKVPSTGATQDAESEADAEAKFHARMAQFAPDAAGRRPRRRGPPARGRGLRLGWKGWLVVDGMAILLVLAGVVAWPPVRTCRQQDWTVGFYAGDSVERCIRRGIATRLDIADQRIKSLIRGSGR